MRQTDLLEGSVEVVGNSLQLVDALLEADSVVLLIPVCLIPRLLKKRQTI